MRTLIAIAALALLSTSAHAEVHNIRFGGRTMHIDVPSHCKKISCIHVSEKSGGKARKTTSPEVTPVVVAPPQGTVKPEKTAEVQPDKPAVSQPNLTARTDTETQPDDRKAIARLSLPPAPGTEDKPVASPNAVAAIEDKPQPVKTEAPSPVGVWWTEKHESKIRIEACGQALCGFVDGKPNEKVLINMQPGSSNRWNGRIHDIRHGGSTYAAHIALKGNNSLRVEGCAFGGLFCGGETWSRAE